MVNIFQGEGKRLVFQIEEDGNVVDISSATSKKFRVVKHIGDSSYVIDKDMDFYTDGTDGKIYVDLTDSDTKDLEGNYIYEVELVIGGTTYIAKVDILCVKKRVEI